MHGCTFSLQSAEKQTQLAQCNSMLNESRAAYLYSVLIGKRAVLLPLHIWKLPMTTITWSIQSRFFPISLHYLFIFFPQASLSSPGVCTPNHFPTTDPKWPCYLRENLPHPSQAGDVWGWDEDTQGGLEAAGLMLCPLHPGLPC